MELLVAAEADTVRSPNLEVDERYPLTWDLLLQEEDALANVGYHVCVVAPAMCGFTTRGGLDSEKVS